MSKIPLIDPLAPEIKPETASTENTLENLEEAALTPPAGSVVRPLMVGSFGEAIPAWLDPQSFTIYPKKK